MFALLNIHKPAGPTSRDVVNRVQRLVRPHKAGHAGTLDPIASGVLLVCLGQATRLVEYAQALPKSYVGLFRLGCRSETDDIEGPVETIAGAPVPSAQDIAGMLPRFTGEIFQRPPRHSAIKIRGRRAYELARQGVCFQPEPKRVAIHRLEILRYDYPELELAVDCGSGTYIRSLGRDLATALGTSAVMASLARTAIGSFQLADAIPYDQLADQWHARLQPPEMLLSGLPAIRLSAAELRELQHGRFITRELGIAPGEMAAYDPQGRLAAIVRERTPGSLGAVRNFTQPA